MTGRLVIKLGGELIEAPDARARFAAMVREIAHARPLAVVHGGGRAIDAELDRRGIALKKVDGVRVTDAETLEAVIAVLAGSANTELVAALVSAGVRAVGLTGVDAGLGRADRAMPLVSAVGALVDLGLVGDPAIADPSLAELLMTHGYVPVIASLGIDPGPSGAGVLNVNADVMACRLAAALGAELVIAGTTAGVLDAQGQPIDELSLAQVDALIADGTATAGMIAKLRACHAAIEDGVSSVRLVDGRRFDAGVDVAELLGTCITRGGAKAAPSHV